MASSPGSSVRVATPARLNDDDPPSYGCANASLNQSWPADQELRPYLYNLHKAAEPLIQRPALRDKIREHFWHSPNQATDLQYARTFVLWGCGGTGKTQLAHGYIEEYRMEYQAIFWIDARSNVSIQWHFLNIFLELLKPSDLEVARTVKLEVALSKCEVWLSAASERCLLIFDGIGDDDDVDVGQYIPKNLQVHVLVTSRNPLAISLSTAEYLDVGTFEKQQALDLFHGLARLSVGNSKLDKAVGAVVKELKYFPLALATAARYVFHKCQISSDLGIFLKKYNQRRREIVDEVPLKVRRRHIQWVAVSYEIAISTVERNFGYAFRLLTLMSFLHHHDIFLELFTLDPENCGTWDESWSCMIFQDAEIQQQELENLFDLLLSYGLLQKHEGGYTNGSFSMHKSLSDWLWSRLRMTKYSGETENYCLAALRLLSNAVSNCSSPLQTKLRLVPHLMANYSCVVSSTWNWSNQENRAASFKYLGCTNEFLKGAEQWDFSDMIGAYLLSEGFALYGEGHPSMILTATRLAFTRGCQGRLDDMAELVGAALGSIGTQGALFAFEYSTQSRDKQSESARSIALKQLSLEDITNPGDTLIGVILKLGELYEDRNMLAQAEEMYKLALSRYREALDSDHPLILYAMNGLGNVYMRQDNSKEAEEMYQQALDGRERLYSRNHPSSISVRNNLAYLYTRQERFTEAEAMLEESIKSIEKELGPEHGLTLLIVENMANLYAMQGRSTEADLLYQRVSTGRREVFSTEPRFRLHSLNDMRKRSTAEGQASFVKDKSGLNNLGRRLHCYRSRLKGRNIRILRIHPGSEEQIICCSLEETRLDNGTAYHALSYHWGDPNVTQVIICSNQPVFVTRNLYAALWQLRKEQNNNPLWADAICINQFDLEEKNEQVRMMKDIYAKAECVIAWLGPAQEGDSVAIALLNQLGTAVGPVEAIDGVSPGNWLGAETIGLEKLGIPTAGSECWGPLHNLLDATYFSRIWIIQEVLANDSWHFQRGGWRISRDLVLQIGAMIQRFNDISSSILLGPITNVRPKIPNIYPLYWLKYNLDKGDTFTLNQLLLSTSQYQSTNPRDKIFALVSFACDVDSSFVDYELSFEEVLIRTGKIGLVDRMLVKSTLDLLSWSSQIDETQKIPSWLPNFQVPWTPLVFAFPSKPLDELLGPCWSIRRDNALCLRGYIFDTVKSKVPGTLREQVFLQSGNDVQKDFAESSRKDSVWLTSTYWLASGLTRYRNDEDFFEAYWRSLCFNTIMIAEPAPTEMEQGFHAFCEIIRCASDLSDLRFRGMEWIKSVFLPNLWQIAAVSSALFTSLYARRLVSRQPSFLGKASLALAIWSLGFGGCIIVGSYIYATLAKIRITRLDRIFNSSSSRSKVFRQSQTPFIGGRQFAITYGEFMGWVPNTARAGDQICLLRGCRLPFVIRRCKGSDDTTGNDGPSYSLIGDCYLDGLMDYPFEGFENLMTQEIILK